MATTMTLAHPVADEMPTPAPTHDDTSVMPQAAVLLDAFAYEELEPRLEMMAPACHWDCYNHGDHIHCYLHC